MNSFSLRIMMIVVAFLLIFAIGEAAEDYRKYLQKVEDWLLEQYRPNSLAYQDGKKALKEIYESNAPQDEKIEQLKKEFPDAFQKKEQPLIFQPPLSWNIHSLSLGYDIEEKATRTTQSRDILKEVVAAKDSVEKSQQKTFTKRKEKKNTAKTDISAKGKLSFNPLNWFSASVQGQLHTSGACGRGDITRDQLCTGGNS